MMRTLTSHQVNGLNEQLKIEVLDQPGQGNACHHYKIGPADPTRFTTDPVNAPKCNCDIRFQDGPVAEAGANGISIEALLAVVEDRLLGFQSGNYATRENAVALTKIQEAMMWLHKRTRDRMARGVEGTMKV